MTLRNSPVRSAVAARPLQAGVGTEVPEPQGRRCPRDLRADGYLKLLKAAMWRWGELAFPARSGLPIADCEVKDKRPHQATFIASCGQPHGDIFLDTLILKMAHSLGNTRNASCSGLTHVTPTSGAICSPSIEAIEDFAGDQLLDWQLPQSIEHANKGRGL